MSFIFFYITGDHRELHVLTHSFPTRRSSDLPPLVGLASISASRFPNPLPRNLSSRRHARQTSSHLSAATQHSVKAVSAPLVLNSPQPAWSHAIPAHGTLSARRPSAMAPVTN